MLGNQLGVENCYQISALTRLPMEVRKTGGQNRNRIWGRTAPTIARPRGQQGEGEAGTDPDSALRALHVLAPRREQEMGGMGEGRKRREERSHSKRAWRWVQLQGPRRLGIEAVRSVLCQRHRLWLLGLEGRLWKTT